MVATSRTKPKTVEVKSTEVVKSAEVTPDAIAVYQEAAAEAVAHGHTVVNGIEIMFKGVFGLVKLYYQLKGGNSNE